jgi:hypothetical protein
MPEQQPDGINWATLCTRYVTGAESYAKIGAAAGVSKSAVEKHALDREANDGRTWGEMRAAYRARTSAKAEQKAGEALSTRLASIHLKAVDVADQSLDEILKRLKAGGTRRKIVIKGVDFEILDPIDDKDLIAAAKLAIAVKSEDGADPSGSMLELVKTLNALDTETLRKLADKP